MYKINPRSSKDTIKKSEKLVKINIKQNMIKKVKSN